MKKIWICILIMVTLAACNRRESGLSHWRCSPDEQVCLDINANEPVLYGAPIEVTVTVTSERDIPTLGVSLEFYPPDITIEGVESWEENVQDPYIYPGLAGWNFTINANQTLTFTRTLYLPPGQGLFYILASIGDMQSFRASNELRIVMTTQGGTVYLANTPIPQTPGLTSNSSPEEIATLLAMPTYTPSPTLTPNPASTATPPAYPPPTIPPWDNPGEPYP